MDKRPKEEIDRANAYAKERCNFENESEKQKRKNTHDNDEFELPINQNKKMKKSVHFDDSKNKEYTFK